VKASLNKLQTNYIYNVENVYVASVLYEQCSFALDFSLSLVQVAAAGYQVGIKTSSLEGSATYIYNKHKYAEHTSWHIGASSYTSPRHKH
jgi:hypothetical protein